MTRAGAEPPDREDIERIETMLGPELTRLLHALSQARDIPAEAWVTQPDLNQVFRTHAAILQRDILCAAGMSGRKAAFDAAARTGIDPDAFITRCARFKRYARAARKIAFKLNCTTNNLRDYLGERTHGIRRQ